MLTRSLFGGLFRHAADRDPTDPFWYSAMPYHRVASGVSVTNDTALTYSAVWAATRLYSGTAASLPLNLYRRTDDGEGRQIDREHNSHRLVHWRPNDEMPAVSFRMLGVQQQINAGNFYAEIERDSMRRPVALWPIPWQQVEPKRDRNGQLFYRVHPGDFLRDTINIQEPIDLPFEDVLHVPSIITADGICGKGVIQAARETIGLGIAAEKHGANQFGSGNVPRVAVTTPKMIDGPARIQFRKEWKEIYGGPTGDTVALLTGGMDVKPLNLSNKDSEWIAGRSFNVEEIARWYGLPPYMLAKLDKGQSSHASIEQQGIEFVVYSLTPWLTVWDQVLWFKLLSRQSQPSYFFEHNVNGLMRGDSAARKSFYQTMITLGLMNRNEVRKLENLNPVDGGDRFLVQGAMAPLNDDGTVELPAAKTPPLSPEQEQALGLIKGIHEEQHEIRKDIEGVKDRVSVSLTQFNDKWTACFESIEADQHLILDDSNTICKVLTSLPEKISGSQKVVSDLVSNGFLTVVDTLTGHVSDLSEHITATGVGTATHVTKHIEAEREIAATAIMDVIEDTFRRITVKGTKKLVSIAGNPKTFLTALDEFFTSHTADIHDALSGQVKALSRLKMTDMADALDREITVLLADQKTAILDLSGTVNADGLKAAVTEYVADWPDACPATLRQRVESEIGAAQ